MMTLSILLGTQFGDQFVAVAQFVEVVPVQVIVFVHVVPVVTPLEAMKLEVIPVRANPVNVPVLPLPLASVAVVIAVLSDPAMPWLNL